MRRVYRDYFAINQLLLLPVNIFTSFQTKQWIGIRPGRARGEATAKIEDHFSKVNL